MLPDPRSLVAVFFAASSFAGFPAAQGQQAALRIPLRFVENRGQWPIPERFVAARGPLVAGFTERSIQLQLGGAEPVTLSFEGAAAQATLAGAGGPESLFHFYQGADPAAWRTNVPAFDGLRFSALYPGVDVVVHEAGNELEYDLELAPEALLEQVVVRCAGSEALELDATGALVLHTSAGPLRQSAPQSFELLPDGSRRQLVSRFRRIDDAHFGFAVEGRSRECALLVDPGIEWSTFLGGRASDVLSAVALARDGSGDIFVAGFENSPDFPQSTDPNFTPFQNRVFVARLGAAGSTLRFATFLGGWHSQTLYRGLAATADGGAVFAGDTVSPDFPRPPALSTGA